MVAHVWKYIAATIYTMSNVKNETKVKFLNHVEKKSEFKI